MKRPIFITAGIIILLIAFCIWIFLFLYGAPESPREVFSDLGIIESRKPTNDIYTSVSDEVVRVDMNGQALQQLTTEPVAGYGFTYADDDIEVIRYVERGTGHIFEIDILSGEKKQISRTTIANTLDAYFSPEASSVVIVSEDAERRVSIGVLPQDGNTNLQETLLPIDSANIHFIDEETVIYTRTDEQHTVGYSYDISSQTESTLFVAPVPNAVLRLAGTSTPTMYLHTKPTQFLEGFAYRLSGDTLIPVGDSAYGLIIFANHANIIQTSIDTNNQEYHSSSLNTSTNIYAKQSLLLLPEKCTFTYNSNNLVWCSTSSEFSYSTNYIEDWYRGVLTSQDTLWLLDISRQTATLAIDLSVESGRAIDSIGLTINVAGDRILFRNKIDNTLWMYTIDN